MSNLTKMIHLSGDTHARLNAIAKPSGMTHDQIVAMLLDAYQQPQAQSPAIPLASGANVHKPLLQYSTGATLRIGRDGWPYIASEDNKFWRKLERGKVQQPWEVIE